MNDGGRAFPFLLSEKICNFRDYINVITDD